MRIRLLLHALDRTGPPMLGLALLRRLGDSGHDIDTVAFRGGALLDAFIERSPTRVLLDPHEPWDHDAPDPSALERARSRCGDVPAADVMLAVSVSAGQVLACLPPTREPLVTWVVEQGEDLHWLDATGGIADRTTTWLAGSQCTRDELLRRDGWASPVSVAAEFVDPVEPDRAAVANCRISLGASDVPLVIGAGIATPRKGADLFLEAALQHRRRGRAAEFVWLGGQDDLAFPRLLAESNRLGCPVRFLGNVTDITPWVAAADVFLHTARLDAFPLVALHAAAAGTPVVGFTGVGGLDEMFAEATLGAPYPDLVGLLDLVDRLSTPDAAAAACAPQRQRVLDRFSTAAAAPAVIAALEASVATRPHSARPHKSGIG